MAIDLLRVFFGSALQLTFQVNQAVEIIIIFIFTIRQWLSLASLLGGVSRPLRWNSEYLNCNFNIAPIDGFLGVQPTYCVLPHCSSCCPAKGRRNARPQWMVFLSEGPYIRSSCLIETFKVRWYIETKAGTVATFLRFSPLLVTSAIANFGTLTLCIAVEREFALFYILVVLLSNFFVVLLPPSAIASTLKYLGFSSTLPPRGSAKRDQHALFMTWTNLFLMSKTLEDPCLQRSSQMILMQWLRFLVNLVTIFILYNHISSHQASAANMESTLLTYLIVNVLNLIVIAVVFCRCSSNASVELPPKKEEASEDNAEKDDQEDNEEEEQMKRRTLDVVWERKQTRPRVKDHLNKTSQH